MAVTGAYPIRKCPNVQGVTFKKIVDDVITHMFEIFGNYVKFDNVTR